MVELARTWRRGRKAIFLVLACFSIGVFFLNISLLFNVVDQSTVLKVPLRGDNPLDAHSIAEHYVHGAGASYEPEDAHPISRLIDEANAKWEQYEENRSKNFRETVTKYREKYGRHPPPGFKEWYKFARKRNVHNIDDFEQIMDDLRPFWAVEPWVIRQTAARLQEQDDGISGVHIRDKKVVRITNPSWRSETLATLISRFVKYLPDMDIAMNRLDQPRVVVPFEDMQKLLDSELRSRKMVPDAKDHFTEEMGHLLDFDKEHGGWDDRTNPEWFSHAGKQYMDLAKLACPPESPARDSKMTIEDADMLYKTNLGGFVNNFNLSTDLCTVGPAIKDEHGFLFSASSILATKNLVPVFSECKVSVNNDILFPANMYVMKDPRYAYDPTFDYEWEDKADSLVWRGVTSGGVQLEDNWRRMHRQRLVLLTNSTLIGGEDVSILSDSGDGKYEHYHHFNASNFARKHFDVGFTEAWGCIPAECPFYKNVWTYKDSVMLSEQFKDKFLVDVDGHSFSGRWRAFHFSKSLGIKATIFREWHDSRLFAWRHFIPMDNRYDDLYSIMTYLVGAGQPPTNHEHQAKRSNEDVYVRKHDFEAKMIATQSRDWAHQVLRDEDIEIYTFRLLLEYGRIIDDNRDKIGYSGDGSELDAFDKKHPILSTPATFDWMELGNFDRWS